jgi:hypothetical protein
LHEQLGLELAGLALSLLLFGNSGVLFVLFVLFLSFAALVRSVVTDRGGELCRDC